MKAIAILVALTSIILGAVSLWNLLRPEPPMWEEHNRSVKNELELTKRAENIERDIMITDCIIYRPSNSGESGKSSGRPSRE